MDVPGGVTLGLLAGGRATRLGGIDKAWPSRDSQALSAPPTRSPRPPASRPRVTASPAITSRA